MFKEFFGEKTFWKIIDFLLENEGDFSKKEIADRCNVSKASLFKTWKKIEELDIVEVSRKFGKTKLYKLNEENPIVKNLKEIKEQLEKIKTKKKEEKVPITPESV